MHKMRVYQTILGSGSTSPKGESLCVYGCHCSDDMNCRHTASVVKCLFLISFSVVLHLSKVTKSKKFHVDFTENVSPFIISA
jgi:hypothetical protein